MSSPYIDSWYRVEEPPQDNSDLDNDSGVYLTHSPYTVGAKKFSLAVKASNVLPGV